MAFSIDQLQHFKLRASVLLNGLQEKEKRRYERESLVGEIAAAFQEMCSMGRSIALHDVCSTPWEFLFQSLGPSANENEAEANKHASLGWEYLACDGRWIIWRRRKAVREIEKSSEVANDA